MTKAVDRLTLAIPAALVAIAAILLTTGPESASASASAASAADAPGGVGLAIEPSSPAYPEGAAPLLHVRVTNRADEACSLAATPELTLVVLEASRDGQPLVPGYGQWFPIDGAAAGVSTREAQVAPGGELTFDIDTDGDDALATSIAMPDASTLSTSYPLAARGSYQFRLAYAMPPTSFAGEGATACAGMSDPVTVTFTVGPAPGGLPWYLIAIAAAVLVVLAVALLLIRRRSKGRGAKAAAGVAALLLLAVAGLVAVAGIPARPASAGVQYGAEIKKDPNLYKIYQDCVNSIADYDPQLIADLNNVTVVVKPSLKTESTHYKDGSTDIHWDWVDGAPFVNDPGVTYDPCAGLYHELYHARDHAQGKLSDFDCGDTGILMDEVRATDAENGYREVHRPYGKTTGPMLKQRTTYDGKKLPPRVGDCKPKKRADGDGNQPAVRRGIDGPSGSHTGDPHLSTFDGYRFDFQAVGEFVAVRSSDDLEIQVRQSAYDGSRVVSVNSAVAMRVGDTRLGFYVEQGRVAVRRDGVAVAVPLGTSDLPGGAKINYVVDPFGGDSFAVVWPDGSAAWVVQAGVWGLSLVAQPRAARTGTVTGLLGPYDGDKSNDLSTVEGQALAQPPAFEDLYGSYAQGWRVTDDTSLFDYESGTHTADFTDPTFPDRPSTVDTLPPAQAEAARAACTLLGVTDPALLADCVVDVGYTGQAFFAVTSERMQAAASAVPGGGEGSGSTVPTQTLTSDGAATVSVAFDGTAGQRAYVEVVETTLPDGCGVLSLVSPKADTIAIGCLGSGKGGIDGTVLPETGRYQVAVPPRNGVTGTITLRVILSTDVIGAITPDGPAATIGVDTPGQIARLDFTATAGQKVFLDIAGSTVVAGCGQFSLLASDGFSIALGCTSPTGDGIVDATTLRDTGTYAIQFDPPGVATGSATVRLFLVQDQQQAIVLNGPAVLATVPEAGAQSLLTFAGTAGQAVTVEATGATEQVVGCGNVVLRNPDGYTIDLGCIGLNGTGAMGPTALPVTGTYTIAVDLPERRTGSVSLRLHT
jgi:hypothetical protein